MPFMAESMCRGRVTPHGIRDACNMFGVSEAMVKVRLKTLRYEMHQFIRGVPLAEIEVLSNSEQCRRGLNIPDVPAEKWFGRGIRISVNG